MKIKFVDGTFIRHYGSESVACNLRFDGCTVFRNAQQIIEEITHDWRDVDEIIRIVSTRFSCETKDVSEGVKAVIYELKDQHFIDVLTSESEEPRDDVITAAETSANEPAESLTNNGGESTPIAGFYFRHGLPSELHIDLTDGCNERCVHCYLPKGGTHFIDFNVTQKVLKEFRDAQGLTVLISGGECMLHKDFAAIMRYAKSLDLNIIVLSNLTMCDAEIVNLLKEVDPQFVNVSLYAVDETIHDSITQVRGSCRKTKDAIDALQSAGVHVRIATPFMRENRKCVDELREYAALHRVHLIADCEIFGQTDHSCANQSHALSMTELADLVSQNKDIFARGCYKPHECAMEAKVCDIGDFRLNLDAEGRYYPCDGFHGAIIGDAQKDSLWDVWTGEPLNKLRRLKNRDFGACADCSDRAWCKVCPMRNFNETGSMFTHAAWRCEAAKLYRRIYEEK